MNSFLDKMRSWIPAHAPEWVFKASMAVWEAYKNLTMPEQKKSFGNKNPDKTFFVIRLYPPAAGFLADYNYVLGYMKYAYDNGWIPVVDMQNYQTLYNEDHPIHGTTNVWEYFFEQPIDPATGKQAIELIDTIQQKTDTTVLIIEHRLEDVLWRNVDRIVLVNEGRILADMRPDDLLSDSLLAENGIREPLYLTAMRYAGIAVTPEKRPAHIDSVVLDKADTARLHSWFQAEPLPAPKPAPEPLLEVRDLCFGYNKGQHTLQNVSFSIGKGEMVSIVGRNGAGKSTLSKLICGFETQDSGEIYLNGKDLKDENIRRRAKHIGYVMQNPNQMISKTMIYDEVAMALQGSGLTEEQIQEKVEDTLKVCGLYPFRKWPVSALSFGQKKRVTIASVLVQDPELILLDEPTAGQDFRHYTDIMEFLQGLNTRGVTVVMITHDMHLMLEYTPRALVFCDGQLIADRSASAVLCDPELIERAALKETSLYTLANRCGIAPAEDFVERFIAADREVRAHGC